MNRWVRSFHAAMIVAVISACGIAGQSAAFAQAQQTGAPAEALNQIALSEAQVQGFLAAQVEIEPVLAKTAGEMSDKPDPKIIAQLEAIAKKYKFAKYDELDSVGANIALVVDGIDPQTKKYVGAETVLKKQIAEVSGDKKMPAAEKKQALYELDGSLKAVEPVKFPGNIDLVVKYYDKIIATMPRPEE
jgi:hypothetical protein